MAEGIERLDMNCYRCGKAFPEADLKSLWALARPVVRALAGSNSRRSTDGEITTIFGSSPRIRPTPDEDLQADLRGLYCARCRWPINLGIGFIALAAAIAVIGQLLMLAGLLR